MSNKVQVTAVSENCPASMIFDDALETELKRDRVIEAAKQVAANVLVTSLESLHLRQNREAVKALCEAVWELIEEEKREEG